MSAGSPRPSTHPAVLAANTRQTDTILALFAAGKSLDAVAEVGATTRVGGWTRARAKTVREQAAAAEAHAREACRLTDLLRANLPVVDEARQLLDGQRRRRGDAP